jgi:hypothetical protein
MCWLGRKGHEVCRTVFTKRASLILEPLAVTAVTMRPSSGCKNTKGTAATRAIDGSFKKPFFCDGHHTLAGYL